MLNSIKNTRRQDLARMYVPMLLEQLVLSASTVIISALIKKYSDSAVAGISFIEMVNTLFQQVFLSLGVGLTVLLTKEKENDRSRINTVISQCNTVIILVSLGITAVSLVFRNVILKMLLLNASADVYYYAGSYYNAVVVSLPFLALFSMLNSALRGIGRPEKTLLSSVTNNGLYVILAFLSRSMGIMSVFISMVISRITAAVLAFVYLQKYGSYRVFAFEKPDKSILKSYLFISIPLSIESITFCIGKIITQSFSIGFGTEAMAANGIVNTLHNFMIAPAQAMVNATIPLASKPYSSRNGTECRAVIKLCLLFTEMVVLASSLFMFLSISALSGQFTIDPLTSSIVIDVTKSYCILLPFLWTTSFILPSILKACQDINYSSAIAILSLFAVRILGAYIFSVKLQFSVMGIWIGMYLDWFFRTVMYGMRFITKTLPIIGRFKQ